MESDRKIITFNALLGIQFGYNLINWLPNAKETRKGLQPKYGKELIEGRSENKPYIKGILVFEDGRDLVGKLRELNILTMDQKEDPAFFPLERHYRKGRILTPEEVFVDAVTNAIDNEDESAYVVNKEEGVYALIDEFNNNIPLDESFREFVPSNFLSSDGSVDVMKMGKKTRNAIRLARNHRNARAYQIKATAYANAGLGHVAEFGSDGLVRTVHVEYEPKRDYSIRHFIPSLPGHENYDGKLVAFERRYRRDHNEKRIICVSEIPIDISKILPSTLERRVVNA